MVFCTSGISLRTGSISHHVYNAGASETGLEAWHISWHAQRTLLTSDRSELAPYQSQNSQPLSGPAGTQMDLSHCHQRSWEAHALSFTLDTHYIPTVREGRPQAYRPLERIRVTLGLFPPALRNQKPNHKAARACNPRTWEVEAERFLRV